MTSLARMAKVCSIAVANSSNVPSLRQNLIYAMDFASVELFSVTYLELHLARNCQTQQTCKQTMKQLPRGQRFTYHTIMKSSSRDPFFESRE